MTDSKVLLSEELERCKLRWAQSIFLQLCTEYADRVSDHTEDVPTRCVEWAVHDRDRARQAVLELRDAILTDDVDRNLAVLADTESYEAYR